MADKSEKAAADNMSDVASVSDNGSEDRAANEEREKMLIVLSGSLENLPALSSKIVRIFTSSTFTGTLID